MKWKWIKKKLNYYNTKKFIILLYFELMHMSEARRFW
jgi:hypothetical protein